MVIFDGDLPVSKLRVCWFDDLPTKNGDFT